MRPKPRPGQLPLDFEPVRARRADPATARAAARRVNNRGRRAEILRLLRAHPAGLATWELAELSGVARDLLSPHLRPLEKLRRVRRAAETRLNPSTGRLTEVWLIAD
jgi:DNA-binding transcriptional ArsR family regulator